MRRLLAIAAAGTLGVTAVSGQDYPSKPIRMVTAAVGGGTDFTARFIAQGTTDSLGQPVIVDNRTVIIASETISKAPPDGYTIMLVGSTFGLASLLQNVPYNPVRDFSPISLTTSAPSVLVLHPSVPAKSVTELVALARTRPGEINYGSGPAGSSPHLAAELFKSLASANIVRVPYKGGGPALNALVSGEVQLMFSSASSSAPHVSTNRLRALAVTTAKPSPLAPGLPSIAASGLPGYEFASIDGVFAPAKTSVVIINRLNREIVRFLNTAKAKEQFFSTGSEPVGSSPEELASAMKSEMSRMGKVIKDAGIRME